MRTSLAAFLLLLSALPAPAGDIDKATLDAVFGLATRGYADPGAAEMRNLHVSKARNGRGYCGEVTIEGGGGFTAFHAILADDGGATVLRLSDYADAPGEPNAVAVVRLMKNFGCTE